MVTETTLKIIEASPTQAQPPAQPEKKNPAERLHYLDGLRGLAALYVVIGHCYLDTYSGLTEAARHTAFWTLTKFGAYSFFSVTVFIVLSGYCLMLPVVKSKAQEISGGFLQYIKRRALRILPGYYGAVLISLALIASLPVLQKKTGLWSSALCNLNSDSILAHLFVVHNLRPDWAFSIDYPLWSVATEWQIYFLFPVLLLPLWKKFGAAAVIITAYILGFTPHYLFPGRFDVASPWFIGLFATGMVAAAISFSNSPETVKHRNTVPWAALCAVFSGLTLVFGLFPKLIFDPTHCVVFDPLFGTATGCLLVYLTKAKKEATKNLALTILESKPLQSLGSYSYSLYLIHAPVVALCARYFDFLNADKIIKLIALECVAVPLSLLVAYGFSKVFESPFQRKQARS